MPWNAHTLSFCLFLRDGFSRLSLSEEDDWERHRDLLCLAAPDDRETVLTVGWTFDSASAVDICDVTVGTKGEYGTGLPPPDPYNPLLSFFLSRNNYDDFKQGIRFHLLRI